MRYQLKSGLTKTQVYEVCQDHVFTFLRLPALRKCEFKKSRSSYWLKFVDGDTKYSIYFSCWGGGCYVKVTGSHYVELDCEYHDIDFPSVKVSFEYLMKHGMLREVAA